VKFGKGPKRSCPDSRRAMARTRVAMIRSRTSQISMAYYGMHGEATDHVGECR
jgi:hypothetical protein